MGTNAAGAGRRGAASGDGGLGVRLGEARGRWILLATVLGSSLAMLDAIVLNVALPRLAEDLDASMSGLQWTVNGYTLTLAGFILLGGSLGDRFGRRRIFVLGVVWFAVASVLCALAPNLPMLVAARGLQGVGGALLTPGSLAIIQASFVRQDRARAVGAWSGLGGVAVAIGPFVGGWLVAAAGWRWVFLLNVPLAAVVVLVAVRHVPESFDGKAAGRFDVKGALLAALALAGVTYALTEAPAGRTPLVFSLAVGVAGVVSAAAFLVVERRRGAHAMMPPAVFGSRQFTAINAVTLVVYAGLTVLVFLLVLHLQVVAGFSPIAAGSALLPVTILMLLLSARAGALAQRIGPRSLMTGGLLVGAAGMLLATRIGAHASYVTDVLPAVVVFGLGLSFVVAPLTATVLATADVRHAGVASGVNNAVARAAGLLAVAAVPPLVGLTGDAYQDSATFGHGFDAAMVISAVLLVIGAILTRFTVRRDVLATRQETPPAEAKPHRAAATDRSEPAQFAGTAAPRRAA